MRQGRAPKTAAVTNLAVRGDLGIKIVLENVQVATYRTADRAARRPRRKKKLINDHDFWRPPFILTKPRSSALLPHVGRRETAPNIVWAQVVGFAVGKFEFL